MAQYYNRAACLEEIEYEQKQRARVYKRLIDRGTMKHEDAELHYRRMMAIQIAVEGMTADQFRRFFILGNATREAKKSTQPTIEFPTDDK